MLKRCLAVGVAITFGILLTSCMLFNCDPIAGFSWNPQVFDAGEEISFTSSSTDSDGDIISSEWTFGDGVIASGSQVFHTFADDGVYLVTLTVTDNCGAVNSISRSVHVSNPAPVIGKMTISDLDSCGGYSYSVCHRIRVILDNVVDSAGIEPKRVVSASIDFGDGSSSVFSGFSAIYTYKRAGDYTITGTVTDDDGAKDTWTRVITIKYYPPVRPFVRLKPSPSCVDFGERICFYVEASDPDEGRQGCMPCPSPCQPPCQPPCQSPCQPPCPRPDPCSQLNPCATDGIELQSYEVSDSIISALGVQDYEAMSWYAPTNGILRIKVVVIDPNGYETTYDSCDKCSGNLSLSNPRFCVDFDICGEWQISFIAWDNDGQSRGYLKKIDVQ